MDNILNIVLICDKNFVIPTGICIQSIIQSKNNDTKITIHVIAQDVTDSQQAFLYRFNKEENIDIHLIPAGPSPAADLFDGKSLSFCNATDAALFKFFIPGILQNIPKVLYLDSDIIVRQDLSALYHTDIGNYYAAVVKDSNGVFKTNNPCDLKFPQYFNSGVMLLNLDKMRENDCTDKLVHAYECMDEDMRRVVDQNAFNEIFEGHVTFLPAEYNFMYSIFANKLIDESKNEETLMADIRAYYGVNYATLSEMLENAAIIHLASRKKAWENMIDPYHDEWYTYYQALIDSGFFYETNSAIPDNTDENAKVSVIVPVKNTAMWLPACLDSIIDQDYRNLEVICINDGSVDFSPWILEDYAKRDSRIRLIHQINHGPGHARNSGLKQVTGQYIMFVDSDDQLVPGIIQKLVMKLEAENLQMLLFDHRLSFENDSLREKNKKQARPNPFDYPGIFEGGALFTELRKNRNLHYVVWNALYNRKWLQDNQILFPETGVHEDNYWIFACYLLCERCGFLKEEGYIHNIRSRSIMQTTFSIENVRGLYLCIELAMKLGVEHPDKMNKYPEFYVRIRETKQNLYYQYKRRDERIRREAKTVYDRFILDDLDVISSVSEPYQHQAEEIYNSYSWKIGNVLVQPFHWIKVLRNKISRSD